MTFRWNRLDYVKLPENTGKHTRWHEGLVIGSFYRLDGRKLTAMETDGGMVFVAHQDLFEATVKIVDKYIMRETLIPGTTEGHHKSTTLRVSLVPK